MAVQQRIGIASRHIWYPEGTVDSDAGITNGYILPQVSADTVAAAAPQAEVPVFMGDGNAPGTVLGPTTVAGQITLGLEYLTLGYLLKAFFGSSIAPVTTNTTRYMHYFPYLALGNLSGQLQKEYTETTAQYVRNRGCKVESLAFPLPVQGPAQVQMGIAGYGDEVQTDLAQVKNDNGFTASSVFNAMFLLNGVKQATLASATPMLQRKMQRQDVVANQGIAGSINPGLFRCMGPISLLFDTTNNLSFYNLAINQTQSSLEFVFSDQSLLTAASWLHLYIPLVLFERKWAPVGGENGFTVDQQYKAIYDSVGSRMAAQCFTNVSPTAGWVFDATHFQMGIKIDGGATFTVVHPQSAQTATQVAATINAFAGFSAVGIADVFPATAAGAGQRVRIRTLNTNPATGSVQIDTAVANSTHTVVLHDNTVRASKAAQTAHAFLMNSQSTTY